MKAGIVGGVVAVGIAVMAGSVALSGSVLRPPVAFHGDTWAIVQWVDITRVDAACRDMGAVRGPNERIQGCAKERVVILPNPCRLTGFYADLSCHEMAHVNGYRHTR